MTKTLTETWQHFKLCENDPSKVKEKNLVKTQEQNINELFEQICIAVNAGYQTKKYGDQVPRRNTRLQKNILYTIRSYTRRAASRSH